MATITPIAYFTGATTPSGYTRYGNLLVGTIPQDYTLNPEGLQWWSSADQDTAYIIGHENIQGNQPNPLGIQPTYVGFWKTQLKTTPSFIAEVESISKRDGDPQTFTGGTQAKQWLNTNGYWTSYNEYIVSAGRTTTGGFQVGSVIDKDMEGPESFSYPSNGLPGGTSQTINSDFWSDWGDDVFDNWGYYYLYDPAQNNYLGLSFNTKNQADGVFSTQVFTFNSRTFTITQGYPVQGIFKFEIRCNDDQPFVFGEGGNMGSDGSTSNQDLTYNYTLDGTNLTLWYNHNFQVGNPTEQFYSYFIPFIVEENSSKTYTDVLQGDNLYLYSVECSHGITVYHSKTNDVKEWVVYDLQFGE